MPIIAMGPVCDRRGCRKPVYEGVLCFDCWRLARMFGRDPAMFALQPLYGWRDEHDAVEVPVERLNAWLAPPKSPD